MVVDSGQKINIENNLCGNGRKEVKEKLQHVPAFRKNQGTIVSLDYKFGVVVIEDDNNRTLLPCASDDAKFESKM